MFRKRSHADDDLRCSFCRRQEHEVADLISSPGTPRRYICDECVAVCNGILEDRRRMRGGDIPAESAVADRYFHGK